MKWHSSMAALLFALLSPVWASAQPVDLPIPPATTAEYPSGVSVAKPPGGPVYVDSRGHTLYGMDMRTLIRWGADPSKYCKDACAGTWEPLLAPAGSTVNIAFPRGFGELPSGPRPGTPAAGAAPGGAVGASAPGAAAAQAARNPGPPPLPPGFVSPQRAPDWTIIEGPQGPQWVYKGWHMVYTHKGDRPRSTAFDGAEGMSWNTLKFVPPVPQVAAPASITAAFVDGAYVLVDKNGRVLFTGRCTNDCARWMPLAGGMASRGLGEWAVSRKGDQPQWTYRGMPVFVSQEDDPTKIPGRGIVLRP